MDMLCYGIWYLVPLKILVKRKKPPRLKKKNCVAVHVQELSKPVVHVQELPKPVDILFPIKNSRIQFRMRKKIS
jgi:hypothetical protein